MLRLRPQLELKVLQLIQEGKTRNFPRKAHTLLLHGFAAVLTTAFVHLSPVPPTAFESPGNLAVWNDLHKNRGTAFIPVRPLEINKVRKSASSALATALAGALAGAILVLL
jgi:hypothetical protein